MTPEQQIAAMLDLQDGFNQRLDRNWRKAGFAWHRAIWLECAELMDGHCAWKWWKGAPHSDPAQARLELVDIWHFLMSWALVRGGEDGAIAGVVQAIDVGASDESSDIEAVEALARAAVNQDFAVTCSAFITACRRYRLGSRELYEIYVGKNALNVHRNTHGYKQGSYIKIWDGREDNEHLAEIMAQGANDFGAVVQALKERYEALAAR
ncbi:MAG: dUTP diphosphatase [Nevskia sp.]|nr:dUTP diphosphatase [Nevskia sp.]